MIILDYPSKRVLREQVSGSSPLAGSNHINNLATAASDRRPSR